jgi:hypothetical protein
MADLDAVLVEQFLDIRVVQRKTMVEPNCVLDDRHREPVAGGLGVGHGKSAYPNPIKATQPYQYLKAAPGVSRTGCGSCRVPFSSYVSLFQSVRSGLEHQWVYCFRSPRFLAFTEVPSNKDLSIVILPRKSSLESLLMPNDHGPTEIAWFSLPPSASYQ